MIEAWVLLIVSAWGAGVGVYDDRWSCRQAEELAKVCDQVLAVGECERLSAGQKGADG